MLTRHSGLCGARRESGVSTVVLFGFVKGCRRSWWQLLWDDSRMCGGMMQVLHHDCVSVSAMALPYMMYGLALMELYFNLCG